MDIFSLRNNEANCGLYFYFLRSLTHYFSSFRFNSSFIVKYLNYIIIQEGLNYKLCVPLQGFIYFLT
jgi:hypothetical protein